MVYICAILCWTRRPQYSLAALYSIQDEFLGPHTTRCFSRRFSLSLSYSLTLCIQLWFVLWSTAQRAQVEIIWSATECIYIRTRKLTRGTALSLSLSRVVPRYFVWEFIKGDFPADAARGRDSLYILLRTLNIAFRAGASILKRRTACPICFLKVKV